MVDRADDPATTAAIATVMARYFRFMDTKQWDDLRAVFTDDMVMSAPDDVPGKAPTRGVDNVVASISAFLDGAVSVHHGHMPEIEVDGDATARGIWAMSDDVSYVSDPTRDFRGSGHYHAEFRKTPEGWKLSALTLRRLALTQPNRP